MAVKKVSVYEETLIRLAGNPDVAGGRLSQALRIISERCLKALDVDRINIWKMNPQEGILQSLDSYDLSLCIHSSGEIIRANRYPAFLAALQSERLISAGDVRSDPRTFELAGDIWKPLNIFSAMIVPIRVRGKLEGIVRIEQTRIRHTWCAEDESFAREIAGIIAQVILAHEIVEIEEQLNAHERTIGDLTRLTNYKTVLKEAIHRAANLTGARSARLFVNHSDTREIECLVSFNTDLNYAGTIMKYGEGAPGSVAETGRSLLIPDYHVWSGRNGQQNPGLHFTSVLAVPVRFQGRIIGVIDVAHYDPTSHFIDSQQRILEAFAHEIAMIMEQQELESAIETQGSHIRTLHKVISFSRMYHRQDNFLEAVLNLALKKLNLTRGIIRAEKLAVMQDVSEDEEMQIHDRIFADQAGFNKEIVVSDWRDYSGVYNTLTGLFGTMNIRASIFAPLWEDGEYNGYMAIFSTARRDWTEDEVSLILQIANQTGVTTEMIKDRQEREAVVESLSRLNAITSEINRLMPFDEAVSHVGQGAVDLILADHAALFLKNPDGSLSVPWQYAIADTHLHKDVPVENRELAHLLLAGAKPAVYYNQKEIPLPSILKKYMTSSTISTLICLPLVYSGQTVGCVATFHNLHRTLTRLENDLLEAFAHQAAAALQNAWMYEQLDKGYTDLALSLARTIEKRESPENNQNQATAKWAEETARRLGMSKAEINDLHWAAMLHDIGKSSIPDDILDKPGPLSPEELASMRKHPVIGAELIQPLGRFHTVSNIILSCREHFDGNGYPNGLKGKDIPLSARVLAVADAFTSILSERPYHSARTEQEALREIEAQSGSQFDPAVVKAFMEIAGPKKSVSVSRRKADAELSHKGASRK